LATTAGIPEGVVVRASEDQRQAVIEGQGWSMGVEVNDPASSAREDTTGVVLLELTRGQEARISGSGFMPSTRADVWLFSEPTLLGTVEVDERGNFSGNPLITVLLENIMKSGFEILYILLGISLGFKQTKH
jgi:hypothetical protein